MARLQIRRALQARLDALEPPWPTRWENVTFEEPVDDPPVPHQYADLLFGQTRSLGFPAASGEEWTGYLQVTVRIPAGASADPGEERAAAIRGDLAAGQQGWFYKGQSLVHGGAAVTILQAYDGPVLSHDPKWWALPVIIPFVCYVT